MPEGAETSLSELKRIADGPSASELASGSVVPPNEDVFRSLGNGGQESAGEGPWAPPGMGSRKASAVRFHAEEKGDGQGPLTRRSSFSKSWRNLMSLLHAVDDKDGAAQAAHEAGRRVVLPARPRRLPRLNASCWSLPPWVRRRITFYRLHFLAFFLLMIFGTLVLYISPNGVGGPVSFVDCLYMATSALCANGLVCIEMNQFSTFDKSFLMVLMAIGNQVFTSLIPVFVRRFYFRKYLEEQGIRDFDSVAGSSVAGGDEDRMMDLAEEVTSEVDSAEATTDNGPGSADASMHGRPNTPGKSGNPNRWTSLSGTKPSGPEEGESLQAVERTSSGTAVGDVLPRVNSGFLGDVLGRGEGSGRGDASGRGSKRMVHAPSAGDLLEGLFSARDGDSSGVQAGQTPSTPPSQITPGSALGGSGGLLRTPSARANVVGFSPNEGGGGLRPSRQELESRANATWSGDTAQLNAKRLKALIEAARQQEQAATPLLQRGSSILFRDDNNTNDSVIMDAGNLAPGERRLIELRALELLSWLVPVYMLGWWLAAFVGLLLSLRLNPFYMQILNDNEINVGFMAAFQTVAGFTNSGMALLDANLVPFQGYVPYLLIVGILILVGNTMYAPTLRFLLVVISKCGTTEQRFVSQYLLEHPRKCFTHLFPASDTVWLVVTVLLFNSTEFFFWCILDWNSAALEGLSTWDKIVDGIFQSISTRNAGFTVVSIAMLSFAMLFLYLGMMYVAVYPVYLTRQRSREQREVYDDEDLQIFYEDLDEGVLDKGVLGQGKKMLSRDSAILFLAVFIICIIERDQTLAEPVSFSIFNIVFEVISAYGNVGLSIGYTCMPGTSCVSPTVPYSFSGVWKVPAKLILILIIFMGRHRGLPDNIDAAIVIPDQKRFRRTIPQGHTGNTQVHIKMPASRPQQNLHPRRNAAPSDASGPMPRHGATGDRNIRTVSGESLLPSR